MKGGRRKGGKKGGRRKGGREGGREGEKKGGRADKVFNGKSTLADLQNII